MPSLAVVGNLSLDRVDGGPLRPGGAPFHAARALRALGSRALVAAKCAEADRRALLPPLIGLGVPVLWRAGAATASFSFRYEGDRRQMTVDAVGDPWEPAEVRGLGRVRWVHAGAIARSDFPAETLAELARDRRGVARRPGHRPPPPGGGGRGPGAPPPRRPPRRGPHVGRSGRRPPAGPSGRDRGREPGSRPLRRPQPPLPLHRRRPLLAGPGARAPRDPGPRL